MSNKLLCNVLGMILELDGQNVLLLKNPIPAPFFKSKDGLGMLSHIEKLRERFVVVAVSEKPGEGLIPDWPDSVPSKVRPRNILASDLSPLQLFEDGSVVAEFGNS